MTNKSKGRRLSSLVSLEQQKLAAALLLCSPFLPLLFIGQEYGETAPFLFFTSFQEATLVEAVRDGRRKEFAANDADTDFPDPQAEATFQQSKLDWAKLPPATLHRSSQLISQSTLPAQTVCVPEQLRKDLTEVAFDEKARRLVMMRADASGER